MAKYEEMTPTQYAQKVGLTLNAITKALRENRYPTGVVKVTKFGRFYVLKVDTSKIV
jgi:hypothetical protein